MKLQFSGFWVSGGLGGGEFALFFDATKFDELQDVYLAKGDMGPYSVRLAKDTIERHLEEQSGDVLAVWSGGHKAQRSEFQNALNAHHMLHLVQKAVHLAPPKRPVVLMDF